MYNPSRGGVRGGADQFSWESVKNDKHRENYLGHSLKAPVGRWQKGKDLSWYAKGRKDCDTPEESDKSELASIKRAEEEAMLIALGHNIVRKETQALSKEDIHEALKRNTGNRDDHNVERVDGVGASSHRVAQLSSAAQNSRHRKEGVLFEGCKNRANDQINENVRKEDSLAEERKRSKKKSKHKKEKKNKKHHKKHGFDSDNSSEHKNVQKKLTEPISGGREPPSKSKTHKKSKHDDKDYSSDCESDNTKRKLSLKITNYKKTKQEHKGYFTNESSESDGDVKNPLSKVKNRKKSKHKHKKYSDDESEKRHHFEKRHKKELDSSNSKRRRHDTSESD